MLVEIIFAVLGVFSVSYIVVSVISEKRNKLLNKIERLEKGVEENKRGWIHTNAKLALVNEWWYRLPPTPGGWKIGWEDGVVFEPRTSQGAAPQWVAGEGVLKLDSSPYICIHCGGYQNCGECGNQPVSPRAPLPLIDKEGKTVFFSPEELGESKKSFAELVEVFQKKGVVCS